MAFGRMNPPTVGHEKLVNHVQNVAKKVGGTAHIVVSHSQDPKKNPLTPAQKLKHAKRAFPGVNVSASDKDAPNFLAQASKMHAAGVTHFHMVGGQDRVDEYDKLLHKYNGVKGPHGYFNFKHIEVHSAGDRDPDAEGVEGMSASKMREHATKGNFKEFRKGVPSKMTDAHAKELYNHVRSGMGINEDVDFEIEQLLSEGVHDQAIFKAVFLAGGPGSGKDYVLDNTLQGHGLTEINSDKALEFLMDKKGLDKTMPASEKEIRDEVRNRAKTMTELRQKLALFGRNGLIINGTGDDPEKIARIKERLEEIGYDTSMIMVNTRDEVSAQRNIERGQRGGRTVPEEIRREKWESVQNARPELAKLFGHSYFEFDNSEDLREAPPELVKQKKDEMLELHKSMKEFVSKPPENESASLWIAHQMAEKDTLPVPKDGAEMTPHPSSQAAEEAKKLGLQYYGFGRYGKNGTVTHRSVHDRLVEVGPKEPQSTPTQPKKSVNEDFELFLEEELLDESKKAKLLKDKNGKTRVFILRRAAAQQAHQSGGEVMKHPKGYVIKIKEETQDVESIIKPIQEQTRTYSSFRHESGRSKSVAISSVGTRETISEGATELTTGQEYQAGTGIESPQAPATAKAKTGKISLDQIRAKQKEKGTVKCESIDMGTEPGLSMASGGENATRGVYGKNKPKQKPLEELTGDETTMSIGDQKEDELKKVGINLKTFKAKKVVG